jgi:hypothetical protein
MQAQRGLFHWDGIGARVRGLEGWDGASARLQDLSGIPAEELPLSICIAAYGEKPGYGPGKWPVICACDKQVTLAIGHEPPLSGKIHQFGMVPLDSVAVLTAGDFSQQDEILYQLSDFLVRDRDTMKKVTTGNLLLGDLADLYKEHYERLTADRKRFVAMGTIFAGFDRRAAGIWKLENHREYGLEKTCWDSIRFTATGHRDAVPAALEAFKSFGPGSTDVDALLAVYTAKKMAEDAVPEYIGSGINMVIISGFGEYKYVPKDDLAVYEAVYQKIKMAQYSVDAIEAGKKELKTYMNW